MDQNLNSDNIQTTINEVKSPKFLTIFIWIFFLASIFDIFLVIHLYCNRDPIGYSLVDKILPFSVKVGIYVVIAKILINFSKLKKISRSDLYVFAIWTLLVILCALSIFAYLSTPHFFQSLSLPDAVWLFFAIPLILLPLIVSIFPFGSIIYLQSGFVDSAIFPQTIALPMFLMAGIQLLILFYLWTKYKKSIIHF